MCGIIPHYLTNISIPYLFSTTSCNAVLEASLFMLKCIFTYAMFVHQTCYRKIRHWKRNGMLFLKWCLRFSRRRCKKTPSSRRWRNLEKTKLKEKSVCYSSKWREWCKSQKLVLWLTSCFSKQAFFFFLGSNRVSKQSKQKPTEESPESQSCLSRSFRDGDTNNPRQNTIV